MREESIDRASESERMLSPFVLLLSPRLFPFCFRSFRVLRRGRAAMSMDELAVCELRLEGTQREKERVERELATPKQKNDLMPLFYDPLFFFPP